MSISECSKPIREQGRSHRYSSVLRGNVTALVFRSLDPRLVSPGTRTDSKLNSEAPKDNSNDDGNSCLPSKLLQIFIDANRNSMNKQLVESLEEMMLVGWIAPYTLLLSGPSDDAEVLKNAWRQRILRNPKEFLLKDVGSVKEFVVESVPHSQFISLSTALYDTVVELDRNGRCASRDTIVRYLKDVYHNVRIPSEEIVHTCLGKLIEQRKIYHDGVGYRALIDNSPVHKSQIADQVLEETREFLAKSSFKDSVREKSDGDSACRSSTSVKDAKRRSRRRPNLSDGSKEDTVSKAHSDEDRHRFNMLFLDHVSQISTPMMSKKSSRLYKDGSRKKTAPSSLMCAGKPLLLPSNYMDQADFDQEIKIIDISERMSVLSQGSKSRPKSFQNVVNQAAMGQNGDSFQSPGQPYDKHNRSQQPKRPKPHRSRSFTEPSKHRPKLRSSKAVDKVDFPLRRVMGTEELRVASKRDRDTKSKKKNEKTVVESTSNCKSKDQKRKDRTPGQYDTGDLEHKLKISSEGIQSETILEQYDIVVHDKSNGHHSKNWKINSDTVSMTNTSDAPSIAFSSDTQSFAYTSDTSSPLQIKKRKDICCNHTDKNSNTTHSNGLTCMCLTGKIENGVKASGSDKNSENDDTNAVTNEDDSIFDYVDSEHDAYEYRSCDEDFEIHAEDCLEINRAI